MNKLTEGTMLLPKCSFSLPDKGCAIAKMIKLSVEMEVTKPLLAENSCSHGEIYAPKEMRIPKEAAWPKKSIAKITQAYE